MAEHRINGAVVQRDNPEDNCAKQCSEQELGNDDRRFVDAKPYE